MLTAPSYPYPQHPSRALSTRPPKSLAPLFLLPQLCSDSVGLLPCSQGPLPRKAFSSHGPPQSLT